MTSDAKSRTSTTLAVVFLLTACGSGAPAGQQAAETPLRKEASVRLTRTAGDRTGELELRPGLSLISVRVTGGVAGGTALSFTSRAELWRPLLQQMFTEQGRRSTYLLTVGDYPELASRIAAAAACSGDWDLASGRPVAGDAGAALARLLRDPRLYPELTALMSNFQYTVTVDSAESVVICPWKSLGAASAGCARAIDADAQVPCGGSVVFRSAL